MQHLPDVLTMPRPTKYDQPTADVILKAVAATRPVATADGRERPGGRPTKKATRDGSRVA
jgi:hypothetical protein